MKLENVTVRQGSLGTFFHRTFQIKHYEFSRKMKNERGENDWNSVCKMNLKMRTRNLLRMEWKFTSNAWIEADLEASRMFLWISIRMFFSLNIFLCQINRLILLKEFFFFLNSSPSRADCIRLASKPKPRTIR